MSIHISARTTNKLLQSICIQQTLSCLSNNQNAANREIRDMFVRSIAYDAGTYENLAHNRKHMIPNSVLDAMNSDVSKISQHGDLYEYEGVFFTADQIPPIHVDLLNEIQAKDNIMDFGKNNYFKYVSEDGEEHVLYTNDKVIGDPISEELRGAPYDSVAIRYARFWRYLMSKDPVYIGLTYSDEEIRSYMDQAGIKTGFFTVKMGNREATQFYSATNLTSPIQSKERYDLRYQTITSDGILLDEYEPGAIFKIGDKEYVLSESHTLDIPYGEDIYNIEFPRLPK